MKKDSKKILGAIVIGIGTLIASCILASITNESIGILITKDITWALLVALYAFIIYEVMIIIISKEKIECIKNMMFNIYDTSKSFGMSVGGLVSDFLLILFACMNFNKIVDMNGVHPEITMSVLALGIFALAVRGIFRALRIGNMDFYIRKFLNTNKDIEYD